MNLPTKPSADGWFAMPCKHAHGVAQSVVGSGCKSSSCFGGALYQHVAVVESLEVALMTSALSRRST